MGARATRGMVAWLVVLALGLGAASAVAQQPEPITVAGKLLWVAGDKMVIAVGGRTVPVNLSAIPLDAYLGVEPGSAVLVRGVWSGGGLVASSLQALPGL